MFNSRFIFSASRALLIALAPGLAFSTHAKDTPRCSQSAVSCASFTLRPNIRRVHDLLGQAVKNPRGETLGQLQDLAIDPESGRIISALVRPVEIREDEETVRAIPFRTLRMGALGEGPDEPGFQVDQAVWDQLPKMRAIHRADLPQQSAQPTRNGQLADRIRGRDLLIGSEKLGEVVDVVIDVDERQAAVLLKEEGALAQTAGKFVVPFRHVHAVAGEETVSWTTTLTRADLDRARPMSRDLALTSSMEVYRWNEAGKSSRWSVHADFTANHERWATVSGDRSQGFDP